MTIWGHSVVRVEKDCEAKCWHVMTSKAPHQLLVTIPWADAFKGIEHKNAPDYAEALATCQSSDVTALTDEEVFEVMRGTTPIAPDNVVRMSDFRKKR